MAEDPGHAHVVNLTTNGGGGNRTPVRGRTVLSVYKRSLRFDLARRPVRRRPTDGPADP